MTVLQHDHSLSLIDLNPKYPHDEEVYDDEEDLIAKQAFQSSCDHCHQEINYYHRYYYKCDQCDYSLHKLCGEVPKELQHTSHSAQYHTIYHPSHQHPLNPGCRHRQILVECDACGEKHEGVFYDCSTCSSSLMHGNCVFKPKRLLIQDVTSSRFSHIHPLILTYSFPRVYQKEKFDPTCRVCENSFYDSENFWVYRCEKCRYYVHLKCTNLRFEPSNPGVVGTSNNYQDDDRSIILRLPFFDQTKNMFTKLFSKETNAKIITHESHQHPLTLAKTTTNVKDLCDGCSRPVMDMSCYMCSHSSCSLVLHELCTRLPNSLEGHAGESRHTLSLVQEPHRPIVLCRVCNLFCNGFFYTCSLCRSYNVDVLCALKIETITHKSHPDHLLSRGEARLQKDYCRMCLSGFTSKKETSFSCDICNFHLHPECAILLPETISHKYDNHLMTLSYSPVEDHEGDYFCEVCEEELNPYKSFYHCHECGQSIHSVCAQLKPLPESYNLYGLSEKGGLKYYNQQGNFHDHPLSFVEWTPISDSCRLCTSRLRNRYILKCQQCGFAMHSFHLFL